MSEHKWEDEDGKVLRCPCGVGKFGQQWQSAPGRKWSNGNRHPIPDCHADLVTTPTSLEQARNEGYNVGLEAAIARASEYPHTGLLVLDIRAMRKP